MIAIGQRVRLCNINRGTWGYDDQERGTVFSIVEIEEVPDGNSVFTLKDSLKGGLIKAYSEHIDVIINIADIDI